MRQQRVAGRHPLWREKAVVGLEEAAATVAAAKAVVAKAVGTEAEVTEAGRGEAAPQP